eukprot:2420708-Rhodomonas_salina.1
MLVCGVRLLCVESRCVKNRAKCRRDRDGARWRKRGPVESEMHSERGGRCSARDHRMECDVSGTTERAR